MDTLIIVGMLGVASVSFAIYLRQVHSRINRELEAIKKAIFQLPMIEVRKLEEILNLELKSGVSPEIFRASKEALKKRVAVAILNEHHPSPDTQAFVVLDRSGLALFLDSTTRALLQKALGRLIANGDMEGAKVFLSEVIDQL